MKIVLLRNLEADRQESMLRFADCVARGLRERNIDCETLTPQLRWGNLFGPYRYDGLPKWLGYVDKFLSFPRTIERRIRELTGKGERVLVHLLDHGNAAYVPARRSVPWLVTCNDLLAVMAARGAQNGVRVSHTGRMLQRGVVRGLLRADHVACISAATRRDLMTLDAHREAASSVVHMGQNFDYQQRAPAESSATLRQLLNSRRLNRPAATSETSFDTPFLLHVGSGHPRKNREGVLHVAALARQSGWDGAVVLAGEAPSPELLSLAETLGLSDSLWHVAGTSNHELEALYNLAHALVFPSLSEGFGWPVAEAQACGCPVLSSNTTSLPEVAGPNEGLLFEPTDHQGMALAVQRLQNSSFRQTVIRSGLEHVRRFSLSNMIDLYASRYERMLAPTHR